MCECMVGKKGGLKEEVQKMHGEGREEPEGGGGAVGRGDW